MGLAGLKASAVQMILSWRLEYCVALIIVLTCKVFFKFKCLTRYSRPLWAKMQWSSSKAIPIKLWGKNYSSLLCATRIDISMAPWVELQNEHIRYHDFKHNFVSASKFSNRFSNVETRPKHWCKQIITTLLWHWQVTAILATGNPNPHWSSQLMPKSLSRQSPRL